MSIQKKLINSVTGSVDDCLQGVVAVNPGLRILDGHRVIVRADVDAVRGTKVTLVSGGGSGHEPAHAGYVGPGMLSGAVAGAVFTSPPPGSILAAIRKVASPKGTVLIIKNYTGDRLNFGIAAERAKAAGLRVEMVVVGEDCALTSADKTAGRRGLAGTVFIHKIAGALAEAGSSIDSIVSTCKEAAQSMGTIGLSLSPCSLPGSGPSFQLGEEEIELGLGIHGEAGVKRMKVLTAKETVDVMLSHMTKEDSVTKLTFQKGESVALLVNNLGGTSVLELNIVAKEAIAWLETHGVAVQRVYCGSYMTSLEMAGVSLTVMKLNDVRKQCLDAVTSAPGWLVPLYSSDSPDRVTPGTMPCEGEQQHQQQQSQAVTVDQATCAVIEKAVSYCCEALGNCERQLNELDMRSGDGDCGSTHKRGTDAIRSALAGSPGLPTDCPHRLMLALARIVEEDMGGSSGALYSLFLSAAAGALVSDVSAQAWCTALDAGIQAIMKYGGAAPGDRTMIDALHPACQALRDCLSSKTPLQALHDAAQAAERGAQATAKMAAHAGRASYVSADHLTQPDPGAHAVGIGLRAIYEACKLMLGS